MKKGLVWVGLVIAVSIWGSLYVVSKLVLAQMSPFLLLFLRFAIASAILLPVVAVNGSVAEDDPIAGNDSAIGNGSAVGYAMGKGSVTVRNPEAWKRLRLPGINRKDWPVMLYIGFMGYFVSNGLLMLGIKLSSASSASLINAMNPIFITLFAWLLLKEHLSMRKIIAVVSAVAGATVIIGTSKGTGGLTGVIVSILSMITWSLTVIAIRKMTQKYPALVVTAYGMAISAVCALPIAIFTIRNDAGPVVWSVGLVLGIGYIGVVCTAFSHVLWNKCLSVLEAGTCAVFYPLQPMVSVLLGFAFLHEEPTVQFVAGSLLIVAGVLANVLPTKKGKNKTPASVAENATMPAGSRPWRLSGVQRQRIN